MPGTVAKAVKFVDELVKQSGKQGTQVAKNVATALLPSDRPEMALLLVRLKNARKVAANAKAGLDAFCAAAELARGEKQFALAKVREERQDEIDAWKDTTSRGEATLEKMREEMSGTMDMLRAEHDVAAACHPELLAVIR